jgi:hypothetical protein
LVTTKPTLEGDAATLTKQLEVNSAMADCSLTSIRASGKKPA